MLKYDMVSQIALESFQVDQQHQALSKQHKKQMLTLCIRKSLTYSALLVQESKKKVKNIQQQGFANGHPLDY